MVKIVGTSSFLELDVTSLKNLFRCDELKISEADLFKALMR
jgi:hypothetical protein